MMMKRCHFENALFGSLKMYNLNHNGKHFRQEHTADHHQQQFLFSNHSAGRQQTAQGQASCIAHEDLCRMHIEF